MTFGNDTGEAASTSLLQSPELRDALIRFFRRRLHNPGEIEDLVQEVFLRMVVRGDVETLAALRAYAYQTAASVLADRHRRRSARSADFHEMLDPERHGSEDFDPERVLLGKEELRHAVAAVMALPERTRQIFILRRIEGFRYAEIAAQVGISVSAVEKHMIRATHHILTSLGTPDDQ